MSDPTRAVSNYAVDPYSAEFHNDHTSLMKFLTGAVGIGKSWTCIFELMFHACRAIPPTQRKHTGSRRARIAIIRKTYPRLQTTVLVSLQSIFRNSLKITYDYPIVAEVTVPDPFSPGESIDLEFILLAIGDEKHEDELKKLRSLEITSAYVNELNEYDTPGFLGELLGRCGRYPTAAKEIGPSGVLEDILGSDGKPVGYTGGKLLIGDYNKGGVESWTAKWHMDEKGERPDNVRFFDYPAPIVEVRDTNDVVVGYEANPLAATFASKQPAGVAYWLELAAASKADTHYIHSLLLNKYGSVRYGNPVFSNFKRESHVLPSRVRADSQRGMVIGFDHSGLQPAMCLMQTGAKGIILLDELVAFDTTPDDFLHSIFVPWWHSLGLPRGSVEIVCDPAEQRGRSIDVTMVRALQQLGFVRAHPASSTWGRDPGRMIRVVNESFSRGMLHLNPSLDWALRACAGAYSYRKLNSSFSATSATPTKDQFSHIADAIQYGVTHIRLGPQQGVTSRTTEVRSGIL
jgi:hypothetical protein